MNNDPNEQRNYQNYQQNGNPQGGSQQQYPYGVPPQQGFVPETEAPMSVGEWVLTVFLTQLPCVGIILLFVWGFGNEEGKRTRANYCKAMLILGLIAGVLSILASVIAAVAGFSLLEGLSGSFSIL